MHLPRLIIAGVQSGVGKTTLTLGIISALHRRGLQVQPFKVGPDYIDSGLHFWAANRPSFNLDNWMCPPDMVKQVFATNAARVDISIIEGVMGLFDGVRGGSIEGSSADIALLLRAPVILVVNVGAMAQSCVALVKGFRDYHPDVQLAGVILNRASAYHRLWIKPALEQELGLPVLGCFEANEQIFMPERHLGLLPADENQELAGLIEKMAGLVEQHLDLDALLALAQKAPKLIVSTEKKTKDKQVRIGIARDQAFTFYYQDSLDYLEEMGAELIPFSPINDRILPDVDGVYIGGGFPEMFLQALSSNESMINSIAEANLREMPIYAECGGYMYLCCEILDWSGRAWNGAGLIPARIKMTKKLQALGYVEARALQDSPLGAAGDILRGHEFHYSLVEGLDSKKSAFAFYGGPNSEGRPEGYAKGNLIASYLHIQMRSHPEAVGRLIQACSRYRKRHENNQF